MNNGEIVDLNGVNELVFNVLVEDNAFILVDHRNHIRVVSATALTYSFVDGYDVYTYDFSSADSQAYGSYQKFLETGVYGMFAGDLDYDGDVFASDVGIFSSGFPSFSGYFTADVDLDGDVFSSDVSIFSGNFPTFTFLP
jgi:hypothetical protein